MREKAWEDIEESINRGIYIMRMKDANCTKDEMNKNLRAIGYDELTEAEIKFLFNDDNNKI